MEIENKKTLESISFGQRIAEEEADDLIKYFVETDQWKRIFNGEVDIIYGPKGSGKSAIYSLLMIKHDVLAEKNIFNIQGENPRGTPVFNNIVEDPPTSEDEFKGLWKLYFVSLVGKFFKEQGIVNKPAKRVVGELEKASLLQSSLRTQLVSIKKYVRRLADVESLETKVSIDPVTGNINGVGGKITLMDLDAEGLSMGLISIDDLLKLIDEALKEEKKIIWITLDRLDVAFSKNPTFEENALRALFRVYLDMFSLVNLKLKIFLRDDIWQRLTAQGFSEGSHITKTVTIKWNQNQLLNLAIRRILQSKEVREYYSVDEQACLADFDEQKKLFYTIFPKKVEAGEKQSDTLDWMLDRTKDAGVNAPREFIHLLNQAREEQLKMYEIGEASISNSNLFSRQSIKNALPEISKVRLEQTFYAEYPNLKEYVEKLTSEKTEQTVDSLARIWGILAPDARSIAERLVELKFFERRGSKEDPRYWTPFLYRPALKMVQGSAAEE